MKVLIVGVGLIGGSFALGLNRAERRYQIGGCDVDEEVLKTAFRLRIIDQQFELGEGVKWADLVVLAVPVNAIKELIVPILDQLDDDTLVVDFGSTKGTICKLVEAHKNRSNFIAAHPIAGTEYSGPQAAFAELFLDANLIICEHELSDKNKLENFSKMAREVGFNLIYMSADEHDRHLAYISHLSHVSSFALSNTVLKKEDDGEVILELAGSGFASTVRLAKSSPEMWSSIFIENRALLLESLGYYIDDLTELRNYLEEGNEQKIHQYLQRGRAIRKILK